MTGSLIAVSQVPSGAEEYYSVKSGTQEGSLTIVFSSSKHSYVITVAPWAAAVFWGINILY